MRDMRPIYCVTRASRRLAVAAAVSFLLATGTARAQIGSPTLGPSLGIPGTGSMVGGTGIPMGATELGSGGLSPGPFGAMPGTSPVTPSMSNTTLGLGPNSTMMSGTTPSLGTGLSPGVISPSGFEPVLFDLRHHELRCWRNAGSPRIAPVSGSAGTPITDRSRDRTDRRVPMRRKTAILSSLLVCAILIAGGTAARMRSSGAGRSASPPAPAPTVPVVAGTVASGDVPIYLRGIGYVQAYNTVVVRSQIQGQITQIDFTEGQSGASRRSAGADRPAPLPGAARPGEREPAARSGPTRECAGKSPALRAASRRKALPRRNSSTRRRRKWPSLSPPSNRMRPSSRVWRSSSAIRGSPRRSMA